MEAGTTPTTGSTTIADLFARAAEQYADKVMVRRKVGEDWVDTTFAEAGEITSEIGRGLLDLGLEKGDRVSLLANTRPEWAYASLAISAAGGVVVPIYPTNSPEECEWVAGNSESVGIVCEDAEQIAKIQAVRASLPNLRWIIAMDGSGDIADAITLDTIRERGRGRSVEELEERSATVTPDDGYTFIYTSGTTGPPKGCVLLHRNYRSVLDMINERGLLGAEGDVVYLFLPLAHAFALLIQLGAVDTGTTVAYYGGDTKQIVPELMQVKPTYLPSVPRIFEKLFTLAQGQIPAPVIAAIADLGGQIKDLEVQGEPVPQELLDRWNAPIEGDEQGRSLAQIAGFVQGLFGGRLREAVTGAAPIASEILRFFYGAGIPVMEGYGMTETATVSTTSTPEHHKFGSVGRPLPGVEVKIAEDGEILIKGANIFNGYYKNDDASFGAIVDGWLHTGDVGKVDEDGFVFITGRKKDIIITAGGKNLTPANLENDLKQSRWVSQAVMHGDRRPFPVMLITLDEEEMVPWAQQNGIEDTSAAALARNEQVHALIQAELDRANEKYAQVEQVKKFFILDHDLSQETGELTPTLKVKRNVVNEKYADQFDELYGGRSKAGPPARAGDRVPRPRRGRTLFLVRSDPTDNGGLFVGRRPGTKPVHYRSEPVEGTARRRRRDAVVAAALLVLMVAVNLLFWGPVEIGWLWIVSHIPFLAVRIFLALVVAFVGILLTLMAGLVVLKQLDRAWILVRRASGVDQRDGVIGRVFAYTAVVGASLFGIWMIFGGGLANSLMGPSA